MTASGKVRFRTSSEECPLELGMQFHVWDGRLGLWVLVEVTEHRSTISTPFSLYRTTVFYEEVVSPPAQDAYHGWSARKMTTWERIIRWFRGS